MKKIIKIFSILSVVYLLIGLTIYLIADPGVRGSTIYWLIFWPVGILYYSHIS